MIPPQATLGSRRPLRQGSANGLWITSYWRRRRVELDDELELDLSELADDELDDFSVDVDFDFSAGLSDDFSDFSVDAGVELGASLPCPSR